MIGVTNCTISYNIQIQLPLGEDPVTCEPIFEIREVSESFRASLERDTSKGTISRLPGSDITTHAYSGKADMLPSELPDWYIPGRILNVTFDNGFSAEAYVYQTLTGRLNLESFFGTHIELVLKY